jgi:hypothetical protein
MFRICALDLALVAVILLSCTEIRRMSTARGLRWGLAENINGAYCKSKARETVHRLEKLGQHLLFQEFHLPNSSVGYS